MWNNGLMQCRLYSVQHGFFPFILSLTLVLLSLPPGKIQRFVINLNRRNKEFYRSKTFLAGNYSNFRCQNELCFSGTYLQIIWGGVVEFPQKY